MLNISHFLIHRRHLHFYISLIKQFSSHDFFSAESSYSSESETVNSGRSRSRRRSINLRTKAAQGDDHLLPQYKSQSSEENNSWNWAGNEYYAMVYSVVNFLNNFLSLLKVVRLVSSLLLAC